jgi:hypothetical protein
MFCLECFVVAVVVVFRLFFLIAAKHNAAPHHTAPYRQAIVARSMLMFFFIYPQMPLWLTCL